MSDQAPFANAAGRRLRIGLIAVLTLTVLVGLAIPTYGPHVVARSVGFYAWYALLACVLFIGAAWLLGLILQRPDTDHDG
jgi:uncharacterized membrane protein YhdT